MPADPRHNSAACFGSLRAGAWFAMSKIDYEHFNRILAELSNSDEGGSILLVAILDRPCRRCLASRHRVVKQLRKEEGPAEGGFAREFAFFAVCDPAAARQGSLATTEDVAVHALRAALVFLV
jgi:hypothetical protein